MSIYGTIHLYMVTIRLYMVTIHLYMVISTDQDIKARRSLKSRDHENPGAATVDPSGCYGLSSDR